jgi:ABC-type transport system involved in multi-copper enzyme maturation permease subunit
MLTLLSNPSFLFGTFLLALLQCVAAIPWYFALDPKSAKGLFTTKEGWLRIGGILVAAWGGLALLLAYRNASEGMNWIGRSYGIILHMQLLADFLIWLPHGLTLLMPKTGAVALAAYREGWRQPMFWLILAGAKLLMAVTIVLPYFTFGDDYLMMKLIGFDIIMLAALLFGTIAASISVSEEIEGRTAVTVMSKPITRRSFLFGKFLGITMTCLGMSLILALNFNNALLAQREFDLINYDRSEDKLANQAKAVVLPAVAEVFPSGTLNEFTKWAATWMAESYTHLFGILLGFGQVMILVAISVAIATRLNFIVALLIVLFVYLAGHLAPTVARVTDIRGGNGTASVVVNFLAKTFDVLLPALEYFHLGPAIIRDTPLDLGAYIQYSLKVFGYASLYTAIVMVIGLLLFEDRDVA